MEITYREQLVTTFGQDNVDAYEKWDIDSPIDDDRNFVFSCMNTLEWLIFNGSKEQEIDYYNQVKNALQAAGGDEIFTGNDFGFHSFIREILQNSLDHAVRGDGEAEISIQMEDTSLIYTHNGRPFGFETSKPTSTMLGLFKPLTRIKKYDFRIGRFGIGFKSWILFYREFKLTTVWNRCKFSCKIRVDQNVADGEQFILEMETYSFDQVDQSDTIEFEFSDRIVGDGEWEFEENDLLKIITSTLSTWNQKEVAISFTDMAKSEQKFLSKISKKELGKVNVDRIDVSYENKLVESNIIYSPNISAIRDEELVNRQNNKMTLHQFIENKFKNPNKDNDSIVDVEQWYDLPTLVMRTTPEFENRYPVLSSLMPLTEPLQQANPVKFDFHWEMQNDRKRLVSEYSEEKRKTLNLLVAKQLLIEYFSFTNQIPEQNQFAWLKFLDPSEALIDKVFSLHISKSSKFEADIIEAYAPLKSGFEKAMKNPNGKIIKTGKRNPKKLPGGDVFVDWCNKSLTKQNKNALFNDIPAIGHILVRPSNSLSVRSLEELSWQEIAIRFQEEGLYPKLIEFLSTNDETKTIIPSLPLPGKHECVLLVPSKLQYDNEDVGSLISLLKSGKRSFKVVGQSQKKNYDRFFNIYESYNKFGIPKGQRKVFLMTNKTNCEEVFDFLLSNLGGKFADDRDFDVLKESLRFQNSIVEANVSRWNEEEYEDALSGLVLIPRYDQENCRSLHIGTNEISAWTGWPKWNESFNKKSKWFSPHLLPKKLVENGLIILKDSQKENASWLTEQDISVNIGLPLNSNLIMEAFGECLLKKSTNFVKVDVNKSHNETVLKRWMSPLPRLMKVSSLASYDIGEYNVNALSDKHDRGAESEMSFSASDEIKVKIPHQVWKDGGRISSETYYMEINPDEVAKHKDEKRVLENNKFMNHIIWPIVRHRKAKGYIGTSGFTLQFVHVYEHLNSADQSENESLLACYEVLCKFKKVSEAKPGASFQRVRRTYAGRFGKCKDGRPISMKMSWFPPNRTATPQIGYIPVEDDFYVNLESEFKRNASLKPLIVAQDKHNSSSGKIGVKYLSNEIYGYIDFSQGLGEFLKSQEIEVIGDWYESLEEYFASKFWENFDRKVNLSEQRVNELTNVEWADDIWKSFIETISEVVDADELLQRFDTLLSTDPSGALKELSAKNPKVNFHPAFEAFEKGRKQKNLSASKKLRFISEIYRNTYLKPTIISDNEVQYLGWHPGEDFRVLSTRFSDKLIGNDANALQVDQLLVKNSGDVEIEQLESEYTNEQFIEIPSAWKDSFDIFTNFVNEQNDSNLEPKFIEEKIDEESKLFNSRLLIGTNGWDIRWDDKNLIFITSKSENPHLRNKAECLKLACEKYIRILFFDKGSKQIIDEFNKRFFQTSTIFGNLQSWHETHDDTDVDAYIAKCTKSEIEGLYGLVLNNLRVIWNQKGAVVPGSDSDKLMSMQLNLRESERNTQDFVETKFERLFDDWYRGKSMAQDEPMMFLELPCLRKNLFSSHRVGKQMVTVGSRKKQRRMTHHKLDKFFGSQIQVGTVFARMLMNFDSGLIRLNDQGRSLKNDVINKIASGEIEIPADRILLVRDGLLIQGRPSTLRIHVFHMVAMAAVESLLDEVE